VRSIVIAAVLAVCAAGLCAEPARGKLVLVTIGGARLDQVTARGLPAISRLIRRGAIGVMNARPSTVRPEGEDMGLGRYSTEGGCATIGAGTRAAATIDGRQAYSAFETENGRPVRELYTSRYGQGPGSAEVLHLGMNRLWFVNSEARYPVEPGAVGSALHAAGLKTAAIGNSDTPTDLRRETALIAADATGIVDYGDVSSRLVRPDPRAPYGWRTDGARLISAFRRVLPKADFIVVDTGDTSRAASYARHCTERQAARLERRALALADRIIGQIAGSLDLSRDRIIILSPSPSEQAIEDFDFLPPMIAAGRGIGRGLLTSGSTRRPGIVTNADISATVLGFFGVGQPVSFVGRPVGVVRGTVRCLEADNQKIILQMQRQPAMRGLADFLIAYVIFLTGYALWRRGEWPRWVSWAGLVPVASMLAVLWLPGFTDLGLAGSVAALGGLLAALLVLSWVGLRSPGRALAWLCGAVTLTILADLARDGVLLRDSIMSYTPADGARYYGIGNEHMGSAIGAALVGAGLVLSAAGRLRPLGTALLSAVLLAVVAAIGLPALGANVGGAMSAVAAAVVGLTLWRGGRIRRAHVIAAALVVLLLPGILLVFDIARSGGAQSHMGRAAHLIATGGTGEILTIIERKAAMNLTLIQHSPWSKLLGASILGVIALLAAVAPAHLRRIRDDRGIYGGAVAATVGAFAALALNDSGVVAAATAFIYVWAVTLVAAAPEKAAERRT